MPILVRVPWDTRVLVEVQTLVLLQEAGRRAGHNIQLSSSVASLNRNEGNGGWRSWDSQNALYQGWLKGLPGYNVASNPDTGLRQHMRGAAVDILNKADRIHMLAVGFTPDAGEWWHFNHPRWAAMPIIRNLAAAGLGSTPIGDDLSAEAERQINALYNYYAPGIAGKHFDMEAVARAKNIERLVDLVWRSTTPGITNVKEDGELYRLAKWAHQNTDGILKSQDTLPGRIWDFELERPDGPPNADGTRRRTRAGDMQRFGQAWTDDIVKTVIANSGKPLTDAQIKLVAEILAKQLPRVDEQSIVDRVLAGIRAFLVRAAA